MIRLCSRSAGRLDNTLDVIRFNDNPVLAQLLLDEDDLFRTLDDKVTTRIEGALGHTGELCLGTPGQDAFVTSQHDGQTTNVHVWSPHDVLSAGILNRDENRCTICYVA